MPSKLSSKRHLGITQESRLYTPFLALVSNVEIPTAYICKNFISFSDDILEVEYNSTEFCKDRKSQRPVSSVIQFRCNKTAPLNVCTTKIIEPAHEIMVESSLFPHTKYGSRRRVRPKVRHLAPLDSCVCTFEE